MATARTLVAPIDSHPQVEILQPLSGASIYRDWLDECGEGFGTGGSGKFAYLDTQAQLGTLLELAEPPTGLGEPLRRI